MPFLTLFGKTEGKIPIFAISPLPLEIICGMIWYQWRLNPELCLSQFCVKTPHCYFSQVVRNPPACNQKYPLPMCCVHMRWHVESLPKKGGREVTHIYIMFQNILFIAIFLNPNNFAENYPLGIMWHIKRINFAELQHTTENYRFSRHIKLFSSSKSCTKVISFEEVFSKYTGFQIQALWFTALHFMLFETWASVNFTSKCKVI